MISLVGLLEKISTSIQYCLDRVAADPSILPINKPGILASYSNGHTELMAAVQQYISDTANKNHQLRNLIIQMYSTLSISGVFDLPQDSISKLYMADGNFGNIMEGADDQFWNDPLSIAPIEVPPTLQLIIDSIMEAEKVDASGRTALYNSMFALQMSRILPMMFGESTGDVSPIEKSTMASIIYSDYAVKSIIEEYSLDVYIPLFLK